MMAVFIGCSIILHLFHPFHQVIIVGYLMIVDARTRELLEKPVSTGYLTISMPRKSRVDMLPLVSATK